MYGVFRVGSATTTYRMQYPDSIMLGYMCGDLPEDFQDMHDRQKYYNCPLVMRRSEMGYVCIESRKEEKEDLPGRQQRQGCLARIKRGRAFKGRGGDHNLGLDGRSTCPPWNRSRGLVEEAEGRPSMYSTIGPSSGLKPTRPSNRKFAKVSAESGSVKKVSGGVCGLISRKLRWFLMCWNLGQS
jgi:hypothetical protein